MDSKVSGFLNQTTAPEIQKGFLYPALARSFPTALPLIETINKAHLLMMEECGILDTGSAATLAAAILELEADGPAAFELDPALEDPYFNYEAELVRRVGSEIGGKLHTARSRNDLKVTLDRMRARPLLLDIMDKLNQLRAALLDAAERWVNVVAPGYTHLQPAQPITFGWYLLGVASALERDHDRLSQCYERLNLCPLGAGAMAGTSFPIDRDMTAKALGFDGIVPHAQDAVASRDAMIEMISAATIMTSTIGKMAQDFYIMTTHEFNTLELPDSVAITSSIMPQKKNMAALEHLKGRVAILIGALTCAMTSQRGVSFSHAQDSGQDGLRWFWQGIEDVIEALPAARVIVEVARPRADRMLDLARGNYSAATDLADLLVRGSGLSFREAHHVVGRVVRMAMAQDLPSDRISSQMVDDAALQTIGRALSVAPDRVAAALDPAQAAGARGGSGGPGPEGTGRQIADRKDRLRIDVKRCQQRAQGCRDTAASLNAKFEELASGKKNLVGAV